MQRISSAIQSTIVLALHRKYLATGVLFGVPITISNLCHLHSSPMAQNKANEIELYEKGHSISNITDCEYSRYSNLIRVSLVKGTLFTLLWPAIPLMYLCYPTSEHNKLKRSILVPYGLCIVYRHQAAHICGKQNPSCKSPYDVCTCATPEIVLEMSH